MGRFKQITKYHLLGQIDNMDTLDKQLGSQTNYVDNPVGRCERLSGSLDKLYV